MRLWASTAQPSQGGVGEEPPRGAVLHPGTLLEVADGELHGGVVAVELVDLASRELHVGDERVVAPVGPQPQLGRVGEAAAAHHEAKLPPPVAAPGHVGRLRDLGLAPSG